jgi:LemA protein
VQDYNVNVRSFPSNLSAMLLGHKVKPTFTVEDEPAVAEPLAVDFSKPGTAQNK